MSLHVPSESLIPEETLRVARAAFPKGTLCMRLRDALGPIFTDEQFADLFAVRGRPAEAPWRLALITVLQYVENLSDRQAADAVRGHIDWKYTLGLDLTDAGFDYSLLSAFRERLVTRHAEQRLLDAILGVGTQQGWIKARGKQRTDSTHIVMAARALNRLECVGETVRAALNALATHAPEWLGPQMPPEWIDRYSHRIEEYRLPKGEAARQALATQIGEDGQAVLQWLEAPDTLPELRELPAIQVLRHVWEHQYTHATGGIQWRKADELASAGQRIDTPYDPDAHYSTKRTTSWVGYKVHLTETCDEHAPHLIVHVLTTSSAERDIQRTLEIEEALTQQGIPPAEHLVDAGYTGAKELLESRARFGIELIGPVQADGQWQAKEVDGITTRDFVIDWEAKQAHCPQGKMSTQWCEHVRAGGPMIAIKFAPKDCRACPVREHCTKMQGRGRTITVYPQEKHACLQAARQRQTTAEFQRQYAQRSGIEGAHAQAIRVADLRHARYYGEKKVHVQHLATAAALDLLRMDAWIQGIPLAQTRISPLARFRKAA